MTRLLKGSYSQREVVLVACEKLFGVNECGVILMRFLSRASLLFLWLSISYMPMSTSAYTLSSPMHVHALRLQPGDDLVQALLDHCEEHQLSAVSVMTCVGSLSECTLRMAAAQEVVDFKEELEIVSLVGTMAADREHHLHISLSRRDGSVIGGHCKGVATIRTTAEVILGVLPALLFAREMDGATGYKELQIRSADGTDHAGAAL